MKKLVKLVTLMVAVVIMGATPTQVKAADSSESYKYGDFTYTVTNNEVTITDYSNEEAKSIVIPSMIDGKKVVAVEKSAFFYAYKVTSLTCSDYMENVTLESFWGMYRLKTLTLGKYTKTFSAKGEAYHLDTFPIEEIKLPKDAAYLKLIDGVLFSKNGKTLYYRPTKMDGTSYTVPKGTTTIVPYAFYCNFGLEKVVLPSSVKKIGSAAFAYCRMESIHLSANLTTIGSNAFNNCKELKSIIIRKNVTSIGRNAFYNCSSLKAVRIQSEKLVNVGNNAFSITKKLTTIKVPSSKLKSYKKLLSGKGQKNSVKVIAYN